MGRDAMQSWPLLWWWARPEVQQKLTSAKPETHLRDTIVSKYNSAQPLSKKTAPGSQIPQ
jgi:hypothetical protein